MDTEQLEAFERIVGEGSFGRAAQTLGIAQPTVSARVRALEQEVGGKLFERSGRGSSLTELGQAFLPYAQRTLSVLAEGMEASKATLEGSRGRLSVGILASYTTGFFARALWRFHLSHPGVDVLARTGHSSQVLQMLRDGVVRMGLVSWPQVAGDLEVLLRIREPLAAVTPARSPLAGREALPLAELVERARPFYHVAWSPELSDRIGRLRRSAQAGSTVPVLDVPAMSAHHLLLYYGGAAILTRASVEEELSSGRLDEVEVEDAGNDLTRSGALVCLRSAGQLPTASKAFLKAVRSAAGELAQ